MRVAIIDYGSGNLRSATKAFERLSGDTNARIVLTGDPKIVANADRVVLPGVGAFADCRAGLTAIDGMVEALRHHVEINQRPFLGICVGMQLMADRGLEKITTEGFGWISGDVVAMTPKDQTLKIPQIGWNTLDVNGKIAAHPLLDDIKTGPDGLHAYFVHSYYLQADNPADVLATCDYGGAMTAMVVKDNVAGTQFHPEKSQKLGLTLIGNFLRWKP